MSDDLKIDPRTGLSEDGRSVQEIEAAKLTPVQREALSELEEAGLEVELKNPDPDSLYRGKPKDWNKRQLQTGMEKKHEAWILEVINFLGWLQIPVWETDRHGNRVKGGTYEIPKRLQLAMGKIEEYQKKAYDAAELCRDRGKEIGELKRVIRLVHEALVPEEGDCRYGEAVMLLTNFHEEKQKPTDPIYRDENGIGHLRMDVIDVFFRLGMDNLAHDFAPDEKLCGSCWGLALVKGEGRYGMRNIESKEPFPFKHEWLMACPHCYMGKQKFCTIDDCGKTIPRNRTACDCEGARIIAAAKQAEKEEARRKTLPRVALADYDGEMLWCEHADEFIMTDEVEDHLEEHPEEIFYACTPAPAACRPSAEDIIERIKEQAFDEAGPENDDRDLVSFGEDAEEKLQAALGIWFDNCAEVRDLWWKNDNLIVEVPRG